MSGAEVSLGVLRRCKEEADSDAAYLKQPCSSSPDPQSLPPWRAVAVDGERRRSNDRGHLLSPLPLVLARRNRLFPLAMLSTWSLSSQLRGMPRCASFVKVGRLVASGVVGLDGGRGEWRNEGSEDEGGESFLVWRRVAKDVGEGVEGLRVVSRSARFGAQIRKQHTCDLSTAGALLASASSAKHLVNPLVRSAF